VNSILVTLKVDERTKISDILSKFKESSSDLLLIDVNTVVTKPHLELVTDYPRSLTTALVAPLADGDLRVAHDLVQGASSDSHKVGKGDHTSLGVVRLSQKQRLEIISVLEKVQGTNKPGNTIDLILVALVRTAVLVIPAKVTGAPYIRSSVASERTKVQSEIESLNEAHLRLKLANRANDGFFSVFVLRKFSKLFTWAAVRLKMTPNQVTVISFLIGLLSAYQFSLGNFWPTVFGALLLQLSIIVDCVDGELARYTRKFSQFGAWLDAITDRIKEYLVYFALAYGAEKNGQDIWLLAIGMMLFQTVRHISDYNFARINKIRSSAMPVISFDQESDGFIPQSREKKGRLRYWAKKAAQFPIGERWLVISATSIIGGGLLTFIAMPIIALVSITLVFRGRVKRTLMWEKERVNKPLIDNQLDAPWGAFTSNRFDWLQPSILRLIEGSIYIACLVTLDLDKHLIFLLLFAILFGHYDAMYRALAGEKKPGWLSALGGFIPGRIVVISAFIYFGSTLLPLVYYFGALYFLVSSLQWVVVNFVKGK